MPRWILAVAALAALIYAGACAALLVFQRSLIYNPQPGSGTGGPDLLTLTVDDAQVRVTTRPRAGPEAVIYFGGNSEDVCGTLPTLRDAFPDRALYLLHYRGYGGSTGKPSEAALIADALTLFDRVHAEHPRVVVIGRSLGSGIAVHVASLRPVERLVLVTPYDSLGEIAAKQYPLFPVRWLLLDKFDSWRYATRVTAPTLIIGAEHDDVIPGSSTESLYKRFQPALATLKLVRGTDHGSVAESAEYIPLLRGPP